jgi:predicted nucleotidyltransferase
MFVMHTAERVIATLRAHEAEFRPAGLRSLSLFDSVARGETETDIDIDIAAEFDPAARMDLLQLTALERRIAELLGIPVDLLPEPVEKRRLQDQINRDRQRVF